MTPHFIQSVQNVSYSFRENSEVLLLGQCFMENPRYALTATNLQHGVSVGINDESDVIQILPHETGGAVYNNTIRVPLQSSFSLHSLGSKRIRLDSKAIDIVLPNINLYMHWTQEQILLFFPTYLLEFSCGICTLRTTNTDNLYEKL